MFLSHRIYVHGPSEYSPSVWSSHLRADVEILERMQMHATKLVKKIKNLSLKLDYDLVLEL